MVFWTAAVYCLDIHTYPVCLLQETSDDEEGRLSAATSRRSMDMVELHSDPDDEESYALLDRDRPQQKHSNSQRDKRKFDKILSRKDEQLRVLTEKVQKQTDTAEDVASLMAGSEHLTGVQKPQNCLSTIYMTPRCLAIAGVLVAIVVPLLVYYVYFVQNKET